MKSIYIAGPYSAHTNVERHRNLHRAWEAAALLWSIPGVYAICPHLNTMYLDGTASQAADADYEKFMEADLDLIERAADALYMLTGWPRSRGACRERAKAYSLGIPVFYEDLDDPEVIETWARTGRLPHIDLQVAAPHDACDDKHSIITTGPVS